MKLFALPLPTLIALFALSPGQARATASGAIRPGHFPEQIRVRVAEAVPMVSLRGTDLRFYEDGRSPGGKDVRKARRLASAPDRLSQWELRCQDGRIRVLSSSNAGGSGARAMDLREPVSVESLSGFVQLGDRPYRARLEIRSVGSLCEVVNHVDLEKYLDGLVNSEFNSKWSEEAIAAQVVAARTYALHQMLVARREPGRHYDVDATTRDQVYDGSMKEDFRSSRGVERTRGLVLTVGDDRHPEPIKAFYHSTCGGMTELPQHVWGAAFRGFKRPVRCPFCAASPAMNWKLELTAAEIARSFERAALGSEAKPEFARGWPRGWRSIVRSGRLLGLRIGATDEEGRVSRIITTWQAGQGQVELAVSGARFRDWIGPVRLRSASFQVGQPAPAFQAQQAGRGLAWAAAPPEASRSWLLVGRGNGHGVGMCQWGAKAMGERGFKVAEILRHYYPDAVLRKLW